MTDTRTRPRWLNVVRAALGIGILTVLLARVTGPDLVEVLVGSLAQWNWWMPGILLTFLGLFAASLRWQGVLVSMGLPMGHGRVFRIFFIGQFFNSFMPGACGGDVVRMYYVVREAPDKRTEAASTVLVDRAIGLFVVMAFGCVMVIGRIGLFIGHPYAKSAGLLMIIFLAGTVLGILVFFRRHLFEHWALFRRIEEKTRIGPLLRRTYNALYLYRKQPRVVAVSVLYSLANLVCLTLAAYCFGRSLGVGRPMIDYFTLFPVVTVLTAVPITPGSLGIREGLFSHLFYAVGVNEMKSVPLSLMVYAGGLFWSIFGGILFLGYSSSRGGSVREELESIERESGLFDETA